MRSVAGADRYVDEDRRGAGCWGDHRRCAGRAAAADSAATAGAAASAEEAALACHRDALAALAAGWRSETGSAVTDSL